MNDIEVISSGAEPGAGDDHGPSRRKRVVAGLAVLACAGAAWALNRTPAPVQQPPRAAPTHAQPASAPRAWLDAPDTPVVLLARTDSGAMGGGSLTVTYELMLGNRDPVELTSVQAAIDGATVGSLTLDSHWLKGGRTTATLVPGREAPLTVDARVAQPGCHGTRGATLTAYGRFHGRAFGPLSVKLVDDSTADMFASAADCLPGELPIPLHARVLLRGHGSGSRAIGRIPVPAGARIVFACLRGDVELDIGGQPASSTSECTGSPSASTLPESHVTRIAVKGSRESRWAVAVWR